MPFKVGLIIENVLG